MATPETEPIGPEDSSHLGTTAIFRLEAEYWTITYHGSVVRLRNTKGLHYLAALLRRPGHRFLAADLLPAAGEPPRIPDPEHARMAVTKRIKDAIRRIRQHHPSLGHHFAAFIKTGRCCVYLPDPERPVAWLTE